MVEEAISDLKSGSGARLYDLAGAMDTIAEVTNDPIFFIMPQAVGSFGSEIIQFHQLLLLPVLPQGIRERQNQIMNACIDDVAKQLKIVVDEISKNPCPDHEAYSKAIGSIYKQGYILHRERSVLMPRRMTWRPYVDEE